MPLNDKDKSDARDAIELALELNEPETMLEGLKRLCVKKARDGRVGDNERARFRQCANALTDVQRELMRDDKEPKAEQERQEGAESAPEAQAEP